MLFLGVRSSPAMKGTACILTCQFLSPCEDMHCLGCWGGKDKGPCVEPQKCHWRACRGRGTSRVGLRGWRPASVLAAWVPGVLLPASVLLLLGLPEGAGICVGTLQPTLSGEAPGAQQLGWGAGSDRASCKDSSKGAGQTGCFLGALELAHGARGGSRDG